MTEVVYRLYDVVDELSSVIENARNVPMSGSCMVPRDHLLDLLDDLREALPGEVQQAGAIVEQRTEILQQAQEDAELLTGRSRAESDALLASAQQQRDEVLGTARRQRDDLIAAAQAQVQELRTRAQNKAEALLAEAEDEAARLVADASRHHEAVLADAAAQQAELLAVAAEEHERLVTETVVYASAVARADELSAQTTAELARMRAEVDDYVDTRLADFGSTLERMLRSVEVARGALRSPVGD